MKFWRMLDRAWNHIQWRVALQPKKVSIIWFMF